VSGFEANPPFQGQNEPKFLPQRAHLVGQGVVGSLHEHPHISAKKGDIADRILLPGDPLRAKWIADNYLENVTQFNAVRNMFGFT